MYRTTPRFEVWAIWVGGNRCLLGFHDTREDAIAEVDTFGGMQPVAALYVRDVDAHQDIHRRDIRPIR